MQKRCVGEFRICRVESKALTFLPQTNKNREWKMPWTRVIVVSSWVFILDVPEIGGRPCEVQKMSLVQKMSPYCPLWFTKESASPVKNDNDKIRRLFRLALVYGITRYTVNWSQSGFFSQTWIRKYNYLVCFSNFIRVVTIMSRNTFYTEILSTKTGNTLHTRNALLFYTHVT